MGENNDFAFYTSWSGLKIQRAIELQYVWSVLIISMNVTFLYLKCKAVESEYFTCIELLAVCKDAKKSADL